MFRVDNGTYTTPNMGRTRTAQDFFQFLGQKKHKLPIASQFYDWTTAQLTDRLANVFYKDTPKAKSYTSIDYTVFEWPVKNNRVKYIEFAEDVVVENSYPGAEIEMCFKENYYQYQEVFKIEGSNQQCFVCSHPVRRSDDHWSVMVRLVDNDYSEVLKTDFCKNGMKTRWLGNAKPELHDCGFCKYQSNYELFRNYMTTIRVDETYSAQYALEESTFIDIAKNNNETLHMELEPMKKVLMDNFYEATENMMLFAKGTVGKDGKSVIQDPATNRQIQIGDGMIPQIMKYATKLAIPKITVKTFNIIMSALNKTAQENQGNKYLFLVNNKMWNIIQDTLGEFLADRCHNGTYLYSKRNDGFVDVGAAFDTYSWGGNQVSFKNDRVLDLEYPMPIAIAIDLTKNKAGSEPPVQKFTLKGCDMVFNEWLGVGGRDGKSSGVVSTPVAGSGMTVWGYAGIAVFNPYRSFVLYGSEY